MADAVDLLSATLLSKALGISDVYVEVVGEPMQPPGRSLPEDLARLTLVMDGAGNLDPGQPSLQRALTVIESPVTVRIGAGLRPEAAVSTVLPLLREAPAARVFLAPEPDAVPQASARARRLLKQAGFRLFGLDDDSRRWCAIETPAWPDPEPAVDPARSVVYAVRDPGMIALAAVLHSAGMGGAERAHLDLVRGLTARGHLVHTFLPVSQGQLIDELVAVGGTVSSVHGSPWLATGSVGDPSWYRAAVGADDLAAAIAGVRPDAVLTQTGVLVSPSIAAGLLRLPHVWFLHERMDPAHGLIPPFEDPKQFGREVARRSCAVVVPSSFIGRHFFEEPYAHVLAPMAQTGSQVEVVPAPASTGSWVIGVIGTITEAKGQAHAVRALASIRAAGVDAALHLFGTGTEAEVARLTALAEQQGLTNHVVLRGFVAEPAAAFAECDIVLCPSSAEGFGRVPIEAIRASRPVVYADSGGVSEYMVDRKTGLAVPPDDHEAMAAAVLKLITDDQLRAEIVHSAPVVVESWLAEHDLVTGFEELLRGVGSTRRAPDWGDVTTRRLVTTWAQESSGYLVERESLYREIGRLREELAGVRKERDDALGWITAVRESRWFRAGNTIRHPVRRVADCLPRR